MREISAYFALGEPTEGGAGRINQGAGGKGSRGSDPAALFCIRCSSPLIPGPELCMVTTLTPTHHQFLRLHL